MAGRKDGRPRVPRPSRASRPAHHQMRALAFAPIRRVLAWNGESTRRALQRGKVPSLTAKAGALPAAVPPSKPHDHRLRTCRARTARPRRQPAYRDDQGLWRTVGSQAAQHPGSSGPRAAGVRAQARGWTCYPSRVSYADHPPCHPGCWVPRSTRLAGLRKQQGWRRDGQQVDRSRSGDPCRRNRSRPIKFGRNGISSSSRNGPQCGSTAVQSISRSQPRANADVVGGGFLSSASWRLPASRSHRAEGFPSGSRIGCLETTQARARGIDEVVVVRGGSRSARAATMETKRASCPETERAG